MSSQPLGGICWGCSAPRPRWLLVTAPGSVSWLAPGPPPAAAPSPCGASGPPAGVPWPSLALPPPAVLRPTSTAVASMPSRSVDLTILRASPGRFLRFFGPLAMGSSFDPPSHSQETRLRHHSGIEVPQLERATLVDLRLPH